MKKILLLFVLSIVAILSGWSQTIPQSEVLRSQMTYHIEKTIIRELHYPASISYVETNQEHYFVFHDGDTNNTTAVSIDNSLFVNDFVIDNDTVFFCGRNANNNTGFFGHFRISTFFTTTPSYHVTNHIFYATSGQVTTFDKMVAYLGQGGRKLAAVGHSQAGCPEVAEVWYDPAGPIYQYNIGELSLNYNESVLDIILTDNFVVTAGFKFTNTPFGILPYVRIYRRPSMFANNGPQNSVTVFYDNAGNIHFQDDQIALSHMQLDEFALAAYWHGSTQITDRGTYVGIQSIGANYAISNPSPVIYTVQDYINGGWKLRGMTSKGSSSEFYLLQNAEINGYNQLVDMVFNLNSSLFPPTGGTGNVSVRVRQDPFLMSIDALSNTPGFVSNGNYESNHHILGYYNSIANNTYCFITHNLLVHSFQTSKSGNPNLPFVIINGVGNLFQPYMGQVLHYDIKACCYN